MALLSESQPLDSPIMTPSPDPLEELDGLELLPFTGIKSLQKRLNDRRDALQKDTTHAQFLVFSSVPASIASYLSDDSCRVSKFARLSYNLTTQTLIIKVMPFPEHGLASRSVYDYIREEIVAMNLQDEIEPLGGATVQIGNWKKEADECWAPSQHATQLSLVLEIGLSESASKLTMDAHGWLETAGSTIKVVLTMTISRNNPQITIRHWERGPRLYNITTRQLPLSAFCKDEITITHTNNITTVSGDLTLPFEGIVGRVPNGPLERDFFISRQKLRQIAERVWRKQSVI